MHPQGVPPVPSCVGVVSSNLAPFASTNVVVPPAPVGRCGHEP